MPRHAQRSSFSHAAAREGASCFFTLESSLIWGCILCGRASAMQQLSETRSSRGVHLMCWTRALAGVSSRFSRPLGVFKNRFQAALVPLIAQLISLDPGRRCSAKTASLSCAAAAGAVEILGSVLCALCMWLEMTCNGINGELQKLRSPADQVTSTVLFRPHLRPSRGSHSLEQ